MQTVPGRTVGSRCVLVATLVVLSAASGCLHLPCLEREELRICTVVPDNHIMVYTIEADSCVDVIQQQLDCEGQETCYIPASHSDTGSSKCVPPAREDGEALPCPELICNQRPVPTRIPPEPVQLHDGISRHGSHHLRARPCDS